MSLFLVIDTSICGLAMGLVENTGLVGAGNDIARKVTWSYVQVEANGAARMLSACLHSGLSAVKGEVKDVTGVLVSQGPGSFTGIRVGIAFASGLQAGKSKYAVQSNADSASLAVVGVSSIQLFSEVVAAERQEPVVVVLAGTKTAGYLVLSAPGLQSAIKPINFELPDQIPVLSPDFSAARQLVCGEWPEYLSKFSGEKDIESIEIAAVAEQAMYGMADHCRRVNWGKATEVDPSPIYLRRSTVEERFERGGNKLG